MVKIVILIKRQLKVEFGNRFRCAINDRLWQSTGTKWCDLINYLSVKENRGLQVYRNTQQSYHLNRIPIRKENENCRFKWQCNVSSSRRKGKVLCQKEILNNLLQVL